MTRREILEYFGLLLAFASVPAILIALLLQSAS